MVESRVPEFIILNTTPYNTNYQGTDFILSISMYFAFWKPHYICHKALGTKWFGSTGFYIQDIQYQVCYFICSFTGKLLYISLSL